MTRYLVPFLCCFLFSTSHVPAVHAEPSPGDNQRYYISDFLVIKIKDRLEQPSTIVAVVRSGDKVTVLQQQKNYLKIRTENGAVGWIAKQYLKKEIPKAQVIEQLRQKITTLENNIDNKAPDTDTCQATLSRLKEELTGNRAREEQLLQEITKLKANQAELQTAPTSLDQLQDTNLIVDPQLTQALKKYSTLVREYEKRGEEIAQLQNNLARQDDKSRFYWFVAGSIVFFFGLLIGRSNSKSRKKFVY